jgi:hypothetical protein
MNFYIFPFCPFYFSLFAYIYFLFSHNIHLFSNFCAFSLSFHFTDSFSPLFIYLALIPFVRISSSTLTRTHTKNLFISIEIATPHTIYFSSCLQKIALSLFYLFLSSGGNYIWYCLLCINITIVSFIHI